MGIFDHQYLSPDQVKGFDHYKYSSIDNSPLSIYISHPFWNWLVKFFPEWLAPNVLTICGFSLVVLCMIAVSVLDPNLLANSNASQDPIPNWVWLFCSIFTFVAHVLDGTDGKQARRVGASGPTGELFDHGLDSWATVPFTVTVFSVFGRGEFSVSAFRLLGILISVQIVFIVSHWEKYNTGVLFLPWSYDLSQYGLALFYLLTWFVGYRYWKFYIYGSFTFAEAFEIGFYLSCFLSLVASLWNVYGAYCVTKSGKQPSVYESVLPLFPSCALFGASLYWAARSPALIADLDPRCFLWTMGVVFSNIACRLVVSQMTQTRAERCNFLLVPYVFVAICAIFGLLGSNELIALRLLGLLLTLAHLHYGICVVRQLCDHFGIYAFSLDYLKQKKQ